MPTLLGELSERTKGGGFRASAPPATSQVHLPARVQIRGNHLEWTDHETGWGLRRATIDASCLRRFVRIADKPAAQIAGFAERYSVLYLGENGFPNLERNELPSRVDEDYPPMHEGHPILESQRLWRQEPVEGWRAWSRYVGLVLVLSHKLRKGERVLAPTVRWPEYADFDPGPKDPWVDDDSPCLERGPDGAQRLSDLGNTIYWRLWPWRLIREIEECRTVEEQWQHLAADVSARLLPQVAYEIRLDGTAQQPQVMLDRPFHQRWLAGAGVHRAHYVLQSIVGQLLATIRGDMNNCHDCGLPYPVRRRRVNGRCPECARIAGNQSARNSKAKKRALASEAA